MRARKGHQIDGARLRTLRGERTRTEFADVAGVSAPTIAAGERGGPWSLETIEKVAISLGIQANTLCADLPDPTESDDDAAGDAVSALDSAEVDVDDPAVPLEETTSLGLGTSLQAMRDPRFHFGSRDSRTRAAESNAAPFDDAATDEEETED